MNIVDSDMVSSQNHNIPLGRWRGGGVVVKLLA